MVAMRQKVFRGDRLRSVREQMDISQDELAARLGFGASQMNRYENGKSDPSLDVVKRMAAELNVTIDWLLGLSDERAEAFKPPEVSAQEWKLILDFRKNDVESLMRTALERSKPKEDDKPSRTSKQ